MVAKPRRQQQRRNDWRCPGGIATHPSLRTPNTLGFVCATLPGRTQSCRGSSREGTTGGALAVLQHIPASEPPTPLASSVPRSQAERKAADAAAEKERLKAPWRHCKTSQLPTSEPPILLALSVLPCQAERRKAAKAKVEKERVEAHWRCCNTSQHENPHPLRFVCAKLPGGTPQSCRGKSRDGTSGGALAVLQPSQLQNPHILSFVRATLPGRTPQSCGGSGRKGTSGGALAVLQHVPTSEPPHP